MANIFQLAIVLLAGALYTCGDLAARWWGQSPGSVVRLLVMALTGTAAYILFGLLSRDVEFTKVAIWISISLTTFSCLAGIFLLGDEVTPNRVLAFALAAGAAYFSVR